MGNECCSSRKAPGCVFSDDEIDRLNSLYDDLMSDHNSKFDGLSLTRLFPENPDLAKLVLSFMKRNAQKGQVTYSVFESSLEVLIKEAAGYKLQKFQSLEKVDILALVLLDRGYMTPEELAKIPVHYDHACYYIETLLRIFQHNDGKPSPIEPFAVRAVADGVFNRGPGTPVTWWQFLEHIKKNLLYASRCLQFYFTTKFLHKPVRLRLPGVTQVSPILTKDLLALIYLSNLYLHPIDKMDCIHVSQYSPTSFQSLLHSLQAYNGPTLLLFRVSVPGDPRVGSFVLGAFSLSQWRDSTSYFGNTGTHIFSLVPTFQMFLPLYREALEAISFLYLNSSENANVGMGFGGDSRSGFRLWIDGKDPAKSYVRSQDSTFKSGQLITGYEGPIKVENIEAWGLGADLSIISDSTFAETKDSMIVRKPWITFNQARISQLTNGNPSAAKNIADLDSRISSINQSPPYREDRGQGSQGIIFDYEALNRKVNSNQKQRYERLETNPAEPMGIESPIKKPHESEKKSYKRDLDVYDGRNTYSTPLRTEEPIILGTTAERGRSTYTVSDGFYNPFKQTNEPILRRLSQNDIATQQQQNRHNLEVNTQWR